MKASDIIKLIVYSVFAGICIAFAAVLYLYASALAAPGALEKAAGGLLFGFGLYFIIVMEYKLFTGMVAGLADMRPKEWFSLVVCYVFNTLGILAIVALFFAIDNNISRTVIEKAVSVTEGKLANNLFGSFISAVFCGMMITFAVKAHQPARNKGLSGTLCVLFPVLLFVYMGFEHCIANQAYIFLAVFGKANIDPSRLFVFALITALGNVAGGVIFPLLSKFANSLKPEKSDKTPDAEQTASSEE